MQRLLPPLFVTIALLISVPLGWAFPLVAKAPAMLRLLGAVPVLAGVGLTLRGARLFEQRNTNIRTFDDPDRFVRTGLFSFTRNPMYLGFLLVLVGAALLVGGLTVWLGPASFFVAANWWYIPFEERRMRALFGEQYEIYEHEVPRWLGLR